MQRGPKEKSKMEYARAAYWVCNLSYISGKSLTDLERQITPWAIKTRDGGGFIQPYAFKKYAAGQRTPSLQGEKSPVKIAEKLFPGSIAAYNSIFWDVVKMEVGAQVDFKEVYSRTDREVIKYFESELLYQDSPPLLNELGKYKARSLKHIDAFALLLLTIRCSEVVTVNDINNLQSWLLFNIKENPFAMCNDLLLSTFEEVIPEVGVMTGPLGFISNHENRYQSSFISALTSGRLLSWTLKK